MALSSQNVVTILKAAAEPTRLRILMLLASSELNVKDLTRILGQSQPRISRHLKLLSEAGLIERTREGSWAYFQLGKYDQARTLFLQLQISQTVSFDARYWLGLTHKAQSRWSEAAKVLLAAR